MVGLTFGLLQGRSRRRIVMYCLVSYSAFWWSYPVLQKRKGKKEDHEKKRSRCLGSLVKRQSLSFPTNQAARTAFTRRLSRRAAFQILIRKCGLKGWIRTSARARFLEDVNLSFIVDCCMQSGWHCNDLLGSWARNSALGLRAPEPAQLRQGSNHPRAPVETL